MWEGFNRMEMSRQEMASQKDSLDGRKRSTEKRMYSREPEDQNSSLSGAENSHRVVMGWHTVHTVLNS